MAVESVRRVINRFDDGSGAYVFQSVAEQTNETSPAESEIRSLSSGANTITPPAGFSACTIIFPAGNAILVTLKGVSGDTGIVLHPTGPTSIGLNSTVTTFVLNAASALAGVRFIWS